MTDHARWLDWLLTQPERGNPATHLDDLHPGEEAWSHGNHVRALIHGATYFAELFDRIEATTRGDLVYFTDWRGDADERLTDAPGSEVVEVLARADERGVDVRGLVWRSHWDALGFSSGDNRRLGGQLQRRGAEALLDMRVRTGGSHHQKLVVIRHGDDAGRDIAYVGGIDLCHSRRDDAGHRGDPQALKMAKEYGDTPPWHDLQAAITGPAVHDVETVFRERWLDPTPLSRSPIRMLKDRMVRLDVSPDPLPAQAPPPPRSPSPEEARHVVQILRTYPDLRHGRDYPFARGGERSVARGYTKALRRAEGLVYLEDQYLWGEHVGKVVTTSLVDHPDLHVIAVLPLVPDLEGAFSRTPQLLGRRRSMLEMAEATPNRFAAYGLVNEQGTPIYVHAKTCVIDDTWATIGSDNFNRRSWTHDSEVSAVVVEEPRDGVLGYAARLRLTLAAEHLGRTIDPSDPAADPDPLAEVMADCLTAQGMFDTFVASARALDDWYDGGRTGPRPPGRLRRLQPPDLSPLARLLSEVPYRVLQDPDGRPRPLRRRHAY